MDDEVERVLRGWERLERWLWANAAPLAENLRRGVTEAELAAAEARLGPGGRALPDEVRAFYRAHDGAGFVLAFVEDELLSLDDAVQTRASMNDLGWGQPGGPPNEGRAVGPVKPLWWSRDWLPFVGRSWMLCVDLDPPPGGRRGQVVSFAKDDDVRRVVHSSIGAWLEHWADRLEAGSFAFDEEEEALFATPGAKAPMQTSEGLRLLRALREAGALELVEKRGSEEHLAMAFDALLGQMKRPASRASALEALALEHDAVDELFWDRSQLDLFLASW